MAFRYKQVRVQDGDIIDPEDWNANQREYVGEFNGNLDRDNFPEAVFKPKHIQYNAFNEVYSQEFMGPNNYVNLLDSAVWTQISRITLEAPVDSMLTVHWSGMWTFTNSLSAENIFATNLNVVTIRCMVNSQHACSIYRSPDIRKKDSNVKFSF